MGLDNLNFTHSSNALIVISSLRRGRLLGTNRYLRVKQLAALGSLIRDNLPSQTKKKWGPNGMRQWGVGTNQSVTELGDGKNGL